MYSDLQTLCLVDATMCNSTFDEEIDGIASLDDNKIPDSGKLNFTITDSNYWGVVERNQMIAAAASYWQQAVAQSCKNVSYRWQYWPAPSEQCGTGPVKRKLPPGNMALEERTPEREILAHSKYALSGGQRLAVFCEETPLFSCHSRLEFNMYNQE